MAEILVLDVCARRLSAAGDLFLWGVDMTRRCVSARLYFRLFPLSLRPVFFLFFPLFVPVLAPTAFLSPMQGLAL
jgi:hypothetical protein